MENEFVPSNMTDFEFAKWLREQDPEWKFEAVATFPPITHFFAKGFIVAYAVYNNQNNSRRLYIKQQ